MATLTITAPNLAAWGADFEHLTQEVFEQVTVDEIHKEAKRYQQRVKALHNRGPNTGRIYMRPGGRTHQASAPGQSPAVDTGALRRSIKLKTSALGATVGSLLAYSFYLEFGTRKMAARPMWLPALIKSREALPRNIERALRSRL